MQTDRQTQALFEYLSTEVKPSMVVTATFHTSANTISPALLLTSCSAATLKYIIDFFFLRVHLIECVCYISTIELQQQRNTKN